MDIPSIHCCNMLTVQNETLSRKYQKLTKKYKLLEKQFLDLRENFIHKGNPQDIAKRTEISSDRYMESQPHLQNQITNKRDSRTGKTKHTKRSQREMATTEIENVNNKKLLSMHNELVRKYEKEIKVNRSRAEQITKLALEKTELQQDLSNKDRELCELKKHLDSKERQLKAQDVIRRLSPKVSDLKKKLSAVEAAKKKLEYENTRLKDELKGLDKGFFDEVEDLKYALHKSAALNTEYEKSLRSLCHKFDINYSSLKLSKRQKPRRRSSKH